VGKPLNTHAPFLPSVLTVRLVQRNCPNQPEPPAVRDLLRNRMSLQASHTEAGIRPMACSRPKATQPRQSPKADSRKAATEIRPTNTQGSVEDPR